MTITVFNKNQFVDFWLNDLEDKSWIERTIASKGWLRQDVEVYAYDFVRSNLDVLSFDQNKNLLKIAFEESIVDEVSVDENGNQIVIQKPIRTAVVEQTFNKIPVYLNGAMV